MAAVVGSYLERDGYEVTLSHDGLAAVQAAPTSTPTWWCSTSACPGLDGIEVCRQAADLLRRVRRDADRPHRRGRHAHRALRSAPTTT